MHLGLAKSFPEAGQVTLFVGSTTKLPEVWSISPPKRTSGRFVVDIFASQDR